MQDHTDTALEAGMTEALARDAESLHRALQESSGEVHVTLSRDTAELVSRLVDALARGEELVVLPGGTEVTPAEAAVLLGMSQPQVRALMNRGQLEFRMAENGHRIKVSAVRAYLDAERPRRRRALADLAALQNELGLTE